jgi:Fe-S-cluster containining protein
VSGSLRTDCLLDGEAEIMRRHSGRPLSFDARTGRCNYLNDGGRCSVYEVRPLVCRIFGASDKLPCIWGCKPTAPLLSEKQEGQRSWKSEAASLRWQCRTIRRSSMNCTRRRSSSRDGRCNSVHI